MPRRLLSILLIILLYTLAAKAQHLTTQHLFYTSQQLTIKLPDSWQIRQEAEERAYWFPWRQDLFFARTHVSYNMNNTWLFDLGFTYAHQVLPPDQDATNIIHLNELRPQFGVNLKQKLHSKVSLSHRYWAEFRFFEQDDHSYKFRNVRARYRVLLTYRPINKLALKFYNELHINAGRGILYNIFDQNRTGFSAQYMVHPNVGIEAGYHYWYQERATGIDRVSKHIFKLGFSYTIHVKSKAKY